MAGQPLMRVACVLRSGGDFKPEHVYRLRDGIAAHLRQAEFICLSDQELDCQTVPLQQSWAGWWSKMNLFSPEIEGDLLYFDLDTVIVGDLSDIAAVGRLTLLRDFYRDHGLGSGMMFLPENERASVWDAWIENPSQHMSALCSRGDQAFLERFWLKTAQRWQDVVSGQVVSYKKHCRIAVPEGACVVCFHGRPRPWDVGWLGGPR